MKKQDFLNVGVREDCIDIAVAAVKTAGKAGRFHGVVPRALVKDVAQNPAGFVNDEHFAELARKLLVELTPVNQEPINYSRWGNSIDQATLDQMTDACSLPVSVAAALMPDGHVGYGLPIGGVLATENAVIPYAVGVDIACRVCMSVLDVPVKDLYKERHSDRFSESLENGTRFGIGANWNRNHEHPVMDADWDITPVTKAMKDRAWSQLGTSGSGNHFVEYGVLTVNAKNELGLDPGEYVALLSHSGSRGAGAAVCKEYSHRADAKMDRRFKGRLSWLMLDTEDGQQYWNAMTLMGEYASANHAVIHKVVPELLGARTIARVENHHNYCHREIHDGRELYVHRKGATPAGKGVLGIIPGSMASPCFVVVGKGNPASLNSAAHGAGRRMSRTEARKKFNWPEWKSVLKQRGVRLLSAGLDEVPGAYKNIEMVMVEQGDLVDIVARFDPKIVKMSDDGKSED